MTLRVALLTTDTTHHAYYALRLREHVDIAAVFLEEAVQTPFDTTHPFERERDQYEREQLLGGSEVSISENVPSHAVASMNAPEARALLQQVDPDLVFVFGTGLLGRELIEGQNAPLLNLHGGNPEEYRGLDTHLWAIYHGDFDNLVTTLHVVDPELDTGAIVGQAGLSFEPGARLHQLRAVNTEICVELSVNAARSYEEFGRLASRPQVRRGRYYSYMPAVLKQPCVERFEQWTSKT